MPKKSTIERELPAQLPVDEAETYEMAGGVIAWVYLGLMFANGGLSTIFEELDYSALMDAIEGPQLISFLVAFDVKLPANLNLLIAYIKSAASIEPQSLINSDSAPTMADNVFGEQPISEPFNSRVATIGYENMTPLDDLSTVTTMFAMWIFAIIFMLLGFCCHSCSGSMCCMRLGSNL